MLKNPLRGLMAVLVICLVGWVGASYARPQSARAQAKAPWLYYTSLGDSYSALVPGTPLEKPCMRSTNAWPEDLANVYAAAFTPLACSGAGIYDLTHRYRGQPPQIQTAATQKPKPDIVTVQIGGNDVDFGGTLYHCFLLDCSSNSWYEKKLADIRALKPRLVAVFTLLRHDFRKAKVSAVGYPYLFPQHQSDAIHCGWLEPAERQNLNELIAALDHVEAATAARAGIRYISILNVLVGHELCTKHSWVYPIGKLPFYKDGHLNLWAHFAISDVVDQPVSR